MARETETVTTVVFPSVEYRSIAGQIRTSKWVTLATALLLAIIAIIAQHMLLALTLLAAGVTAVVIPIGGHTAEEWAPWLLGYTVRGVTGKRKFRSDAPSNGMTLKGESPPMRKHPVFAGVSLFAVELGGVELGVIVERTAKLTGKRQTLTLVLPARAQSAALQDDADRSELADGWAMALAAFARSRCPVTRVSMLYQALPGDPSAAHARLQTRRDPQIPDDDPAVVSLVSLLEQEATVTRDLELYLAVQVDVDRCNRDRRQRSRRRDPLALACEVLMQEAGGFAEALGRYARVQVGTQPLDYTELVQTIRTLWDPTKRGQFARQRALRTGGQPPEHIAWPRAFDEQWAELRVDGTWHRTFWIEEWPRRPVPLNFLERLLVQTTAAEFTFAVTYAPVDPEAARRETQAAITVDKMAERRRQEKDHVETAEHRKQASSALARDEELAAGHADMRFSGYVTVSARTLEALDDACLEVRNAAGRAHLALEVLYSEQALGRTLTLPLCRGVRTPGLGL
jgi:hypothetical protein